MLVSNQTLEVSWHSQSKEHYVKKGYKFTKYKDKFYVKAEDLSKAATQKVLVLCDFCGKQYNMSWYHYVKNLNKNVKCACYDCKNKKRYSNDLLKRQNSLFDKAKEICQKNGYILLSHKEDITCNTTYINYLCPKHGKQKMMINNLINGRKCPECLSYNRSLKYRLDVDEVEKRIKELGSILLNKNDYINNSIKNLKIVCNECGQIFTTSLSLFLCHNGQVCKKCSLKESNGERIVRHFLEKNNIRFIQEKIFYDCKDQRPLPFDFYLPDYNLCIEFDGEQHFRDKEKFSNSLRYIQKHDKIKTEYCLMNNIKLLRISYYQINKIDKILKEKLFT